MPIIQFKGKTAVESYHRVVPHHTLEIDGKLSLAKKPSLDGNLIIEGDNLIALKSLLPTHAGKIKCIYIDPPYNTGNEGWIYNDNLTQPQFKEWIGNAVGKEGEDACRHDKWCCMMYPRLQLLKELLHDDEGIIFVSCDDNEIANLRMMMNEIFGAENFFATLCRRAMHTVRNSSKDFNLNADYIVTFARNKEWFGSKKEHYIRQPVDKTESYPLDDKDGKGPYKLDPLTARNYYEPYEYKFKNGIVWSAPEGRYPAYAERRNGIGKDMPNFCLKVPTGGGKTLLATQILGLIYSTILEKRNGTGLVLWVVPSDQIYKDTLKALRDRNHFYRFSLEHAVSRRVDIWEKHEINRLTPTQLNSSLNVLMFKLASANRETKDQLKMFQDSGGNIVMHFPAEDDSKANKALKEKFPNMEMLAADEDKGEFLVTTSLANLIRINEPPVILDEGHKAYSELAQKTIEGFNSSIVVELSATPSKESNILCRVSGEELLKEGMIKLPINICNSNEGRWENCLSKAKLKREELGKIAEKYFDKTHREIRPIVLIQVERVGKDQRDAGLIHSEQVKKYLIQRLGVNETEIAIKTSEKDDIEGINLLAEGCRINWIITKAALQEGWDCPFAYILVSLNNTGSAQSMTQLIGRVLRQPFAEKTEHDELNESYVFCLRHPRKN